MGYTKTPINNIDVPNNQENLNQGYVFSNKVATQGEPFSVMRFATMTDLSNKLVGAILTPVNGMVAYVADQSAFFGYVGGAWHRIYPTEKQIFTGTTAPAGTLGGVGDVYLQY
jgi:hypothetical protein